MHIIFMFCYLAVHTDSTGYVDWSILCCCSLQPAVTPNAEDQEALLTVRGIWSLLQPNSGLQQDGQQGRKLWDEIYPLLPELLPGLGLTGKHYAVPFG